MSWARVARRLRVPLGFACAAVYLWLAHPTRTSIVVGALVACAGLLLRAVASGHITKNAALTTFGPYAYTRNPLYLGSLILGAGFAVAALNWWVLPLLAFLFVAIYLPVIRSEEEFLRTNFPEYAEYARRVPRLLPRLSAERSPVPQAASAAGQGAFSRERYLQHREYNAAIGTVLMITALVVKLMWGGR